MEMQQLSCIASAMIASGAAARGHAPQCLDEAQQAVEASRCCGLERSGKSERQSATPRHSIQSVYDGSYAEERRHDANPIAVPGVLQGVPVGVADDAAAKYAVMAQCIYSGRPQVQDLLLGEFKRHHERCEMNSLEKRDCADCDRFETLSGLLAQIQPRVSAWRSYRGTEPEHFGSSRFVVRWNGEEFLVDCVERKKELLRQRLRLPEVRKQLAELLVASHVERAVEILSMAVLAVNSTWQVELGRAFMATAGSDPDAENLLMAIASKLMRFYHHLHAQWRTYANSTDSAPVKRNCTEFTDREKLKTQFLDAANQVKQMAKEIEHELKKEGGNNGFLASSFWVYLTALINAFDEVGAAVSTAKASTNTRESITAAAKSRDNSTEQRKL